VSFKGDIIVGDIKVPLETKVNLFEGGIANVNFKGSIFGKSSLTNHKNESRGKL